MLALYGAFQLWQLRDTRRGPAVNFAGQLIDGQAFELEQWRANYPGRATLLYFWAEWCSICKGTAGNVRGLSEDWPVTSIASDSGPADAVAKTMAERNYRWPTLPDPQNDILRQYGLPGMPGFIIIDPSGNIRFVSLGYTSETGLRLRLWWAEHFSP
jgi:thiol-disulfide isomerase/thioredoxin